MSRSSQTAVNVDGLSHRDRAPDDPHPVGGAGFTEWLLRMIGIGRRQLPQGLLPPDRTDQETKGPVAGIGRAALGRDGDEGVNRDGKTSETD
jgi:hypothetical protein